MTLDMTSTDSTDLDTSDADPTVGGENLRDEVFDAAGQAVAEMGARLVRAYGLWQAAKDHAVKERKRCNEQLAAKIAQFAEAMHVGHNTVGDQVIKLSVVEQRWQDLEQARDDKKVTGSANRDIVKLLESKIRDLLAEAKSGQLSLFQSAAGDAADAGVATDAG